MPDYLVRRYREGDEEEINDLFNQVFGKDRDIEQWRWKFQDGPVGGTDMIVLVEAEGKIAGQFASVYFPFKFGDMIVGTAHTVDIMVHPEFRRELRKMYRDVHELQQKKWIEQNVSFVLGFPNNRSAHSLAIRFFNYKHLDVLPMLLKRLNWRFAIKRRISWIPLSLLAPVRIVGNLYYSIIFALHSMIRRRKTRPDAESGRIEVKMVSAFDDRINVFWEKVKETYGIIGIRDEEYLNWRYVDKPNDHYDIIIAERDGEIIGYIVLKIQKDMEWTGFILDLLCIEPGIVSDILIGKALQYFLSERIDYAVCIMLRKDPLYESFLRSGFIEKDPVSVIYRIADCDKIDEQFLKDTRNWHIVYGDHYGI